MSELVPPATGIASVDAALAAVQDLAEVPLGEHAARFDRLNTELQAALAEGEDQQHLPGNQS